MATLIYKLEQTCAGWNGKETASLLEAYAEAQANSEFVDILIELAHTESNVVPATWLLKHWCDEGNALTQVQQVAIVELLDHSMAWEAVLHILQILPCISVPEGRAEHVADQLRALLHHSNKFVRAWTINGFDVLAQQHRNYDDEAELVLRNAEHSEAASIRARVRKILKSRSQRG